MIKRSRNRNGKQRTPALGKVRPLPLPSGPNVSHRRGSPVLITGGAGFIGTNLAHHLLCSGQPVVLFDNLSRAGVERNLRWLKETHGDSLLIERADVQSYQALRKAVRGATQVFHFAAQVAVTTSLNSPFYDFEVNARGTLNLLEALREAPEPPPLIFTSTNKVYGDLNDVRLRVKGMRYEPEMEETRNWGFSETRPLDFHSPYGCSKGAAEQYVLDYARTFGIPAVVFRMSSIYGPHQFGTEDHGWVAHFLLRALEGSPITIYGDGKQVRDILFIEDLVQALIKAQSHMGTISGQAFNIGGGSANTISLLELIEMISDLEGKRPLVRFDDWRPADQQFYVSDIRKFAAATGWSPIVNVRDGVGRLGQWLRHSPPVRMVPVVMQSAPIVPPVTTYTNGSKRSAKASGNGAASLSNRDARSKRIWKLSTSASGSLASNIIKFP